MAGRRDWSGGLSVDGHQIGDHSQGKHVASKDWKKGKQWSRRGGPIKGPSHTSTSSVSPPRKIKRDSHGQYGVRCNPNNQRLNGYDDLVFVEKDIMAQDRKKSGHRSLNHLLNFVVTPRERALGYNGGGGGDYRKSRKHAYYNKEQFLQANCQFVVRESGDYSVHITQSDLLVEWSSIEQVRLFCHEISSCPVCLYIPTAAKITRCGHVFCYSCILHYLALSDKKWRKCPICYESIYREDLKSVTAVASKRYETNNNITMTLMKRKKGTTIVLPNEAWEDSDIKIGMLDEDKSCHLSKLVAASSPQILSSVIDPERLALMNQLASLTPEEESERCFIETALEDLKRRVEEVHEPPIKTEQDSIPADVPLEAKDASVKDQHHMTAETHGSVEERSELNPVFSEDDEDDKNDPQQINHGDDSVKQDSLSRRSSTSSDSGSPVAASASSSPKSNYVYFYQASDGQHLYIHPLNGKALVTEYGSWEKCPSQITGRIVEIEQHSMTEDERTRSKYLNHLPLTCEFMFCELELGPPLLSLDTLEMFNEQFRKRKQRRQRKKREERRQEKKQDRTHSGVYLSSNPADITPEHFHDFLSLASSPPLPSLFHTSLKPVDTPLTTPTKSGNKEKSQESMTSFAQALAQGEKRPSPQKTVLPSPLAKTVDITSCTGGQDEDFDEQLVPSFQNSFSNALLTSSSTVLVSTENKGGRPGGSKAAKKGRKKIVLFSTAGGQHRV